MQSNLQLHAHLSAATPASGKSSRLGSMRTMSTRDTSKPRSPASLSMTVSVAT